MGPMVIKLDPLLPATLSMCSYHELTQTQEQLGNHKINFSSHWRYCE